MRGGCTIARPTPDFQHKSKIADPAPIEGGLASLESLIPGEFPNFAATARKYGVDRSTDMEARE